MESRFESPISDAELATLVLKFLRNKGGVTIEEAQAALQLANEQLSTATRWSDIPGLTPSMFPGPDLR